MLNSGIVSASRIARLLSCGTALLLGGCIEPKSVQLQTNGTISGRILDATDSAPIAAATVGDEIDRRAIADPDGAFSLVLPSGPHDLLIYAAGYKTEHLHIEVPMKKTVLISEDGYLKLHRVTKP